MTAVTAATIRVIVPGPERLGDELRSRRVRELFVELRPFFGAGEVGGASAPETALETILVAIEGTPAGSVRSAGLGRSHAALRVVTLDWSAVSTFHAAMGRLRRGYDRLTDEQGIADALSELSYWWATAHHDVATTVKALLVLDDVLHIGWGDDQSVLEAPVWQAATGLAPVELDDAADAAYNRIHDRFAAIDRDHDQLGRYPY